MMKTYVIFSFPIKVGMVSSDDRMVSDHAVKQLSSSRNLREELGSQQ
jgi:multimeric flavodoxin WrbA